MRTLWITCGVLCGVLACGRGGDVGPVESGRRVYVAHCTACHHPDPSLQGSLGPAIAGSSRELIEARVLRAEYPPGYAAKRDTRLMQPLPYLVADIDALTAYLNPPGASP